MPSAGSRALEEATAGCLLLATQLPADPFAESVVLILHHDEEGAHGLILNQPMKAGVEVVLPHWQPFVTEPRVIFRGGPCARDTAMGLVSVPGHRPGNAPLGTELLFGGIGLLDLDTPAPLIVPKLGAFRIFVGYSGWGPGQLEDEIQRGAWHVVPREPRDPFREHTDQMWRQVLLRQRSPVSFLATFTDTPELN